MLDPPFVYSDDTHQEQPPAAGPSGQVTQVPPSQEDVAIALKNNFQPLFKIAVKKDFLFGLGDALGLREANAEKLLRIMEEIRKLRPHFGRSIKTGAQAKKELLRTIKAWEDS